MKLVVDRIEDMIAVCETEDRQMIHIPLTEFVYAPKEGDLIHYHDHIATYRKEDTEQRRQEVDNLFKRLLKK